MKIPRMFDNVRNVIQRNRDLLTLIWLISIILVFPYLELTSLGGLILTILIINTAAYVVMHRMMRGKRA